MSDKETEFIKQLRRFMITLILVLVPFMLTSIGNMVNDHFKIKTNQQAITAIKGNYVSNDLLLLYVNQFREANELMRLDLGNSEVDLNDEIKLIHQQMDELMKEVYKSKTRGLKSINLEP